MNFNADISEQYLMKVYDDLQQEQLKLMNSIKNDRDDDEKKQSSVQKQISAINTINMNLLKLRNHKKKSQE